MDLVASGKFPDLRNNHDESAKVDGGTLYRKGAHLQAWWDENGNENWKLPESDWGIHQTRLNFVAMKERHAPLQDILDLIKTYGEQNPKLTFGEIVSCFCGTFQPREVSNELFIKWLKLCTILPNA